MENADRAQALIHEIGGLIVEDEAYAEQPWDAIALVVTVRDRVVQMSGYVYNDDGKVVPENPGGLDVSDRFEDLRDAMQVRDGRAWKAALVQIRRVTAKITFDFEYDDPARWAITPLNHLERREQLRPR